MNISKIGKDKNKRYVKTVNEMRKTKKPETYFSADQPYIGAKIIGIIFIVVGIGSLINSVFLETIGIGFLINSVDTNIQIGLTSIIIGLLGYDFYQYLFMFMGVLLGSIGTLGYIDMKRRKQ